MPVSATFYTCLLCSPEVSIVWVLALSICPTWGKRTSWDRRPPVLALSMCLLCSTFLKVHGHIETTLPSIPIKKCTRCMWWNPIDNAGCWCGMTQTCPNIWGRLIGCHAEPHQAASGDFKMITVAFGGANIVKSVPHLNLCFGVWLWRNYLTMLCFGCLYGKMWSITYLIIFHGD